MWKSFFVYFIFFSWLCAMGLPEVLFFMGFPGEVIVTNSYYINNDSKNIFMWQKFVTEAICRSMKCIDTPYRDLFWCCRYVAKCNILPTEDCNICIFFALLHILGLLSLYILFAKYLFWIWICIWLLGELGHKVRPHYVLVFTARFHLRIGLINVYCQNWKKNVKWF